MQIYETFMKHLEIFGTIFSRDIPLALAMKSTGFPGGAGLKLNNYFQFNSSKLIHLSIV